VASLSPLPLAAGVQLLVELPDALHPVPLSPDPATDAVGAEQLVRQIHPASCCPRLSRSTPTPSSATP
jgi:hypothetical protein